MRISQLLWCLLFALPSFAAEHLSDHEHFCQVKPTIPCLDHINAALLNETYLSPEWYKIKSYQLDYYYDVRRFDDIIRAVEPLLPHGDAPAVFKSQLYFYYAKSLGAAGRKAEALEYAQKAIAKVENIYEAFGEPLRLVELANLQLSLGNFEKAYQILAMAESRFAKSKDPIFNFELNSNKANVQHHWGDLEKAARFRLAALNWVAGTDQNAKIVVAMGNLARTYQLLGRYELARDTYVDSLTYLKSHNDDENRAAHLLRLAEIYWQLDDKDNAKNTLKQVNSQLLSAHHLKVYEKLAAQL
ncbi:tetratricopeptide repeat protein [Pseudoalteromonas fenneropenaei]|uniref:Tetratricopeptide repeat protein n=1 Tax=Pseudoalteromonas fenneropenaei TaxID=1737459 RepID=A0ABV7CFY8_9GAMM